MMTISVLKDLKIFDAGSKASVNIIIDKIKITSNDVTLNLARCIIDYPATSLIVDKVLNELQSKKKPRRLIIQTHLNIIEALLLHWLFIGSEFLGIDDSQKKSTVDDFKLVINKKLNTKKILLTIQVIDKSGKVLNEYNYGEQ